MRKIMFGLFALLAAGEAQAYTTWQVELCPKFTTNFTDTNGDFWTSNSDRVAFGNHVIVETTGFVTVFDGYITDGCDTLGLSDQYSYQILTVSESKDNGVEMKTYDDPTTPVETAFVHYGAAAPFHPTANVSIDLTMPAYHETAQLAVMTWFMHRNNLGLGSTQVLTGYTDSCCSVDADGIHTSTYSKTFIGHMVGKEVGVRRDSNTLASYSYNAPEDGCDGDYVAQSSYGQATKEYQSAAAVEGFGDLMSAWAWNDNDFSDCTYDRHYTSDFDLNGNTDSPASGVVDCEGIPNVNVDAWVTSFDWVTDATTSDDDDIDGVQCVGPTTNRGNQVDWLRYGWDMLTDQAVPIADFVDIYDLANPRLWDATGATLSTTDDPINQWSAAAAAHPNNYAAEHAAEDGNGQTH